MRYLELCTLTGSQIEDLLGLMKELNAEMNATALQQQRSVASPGTRIFVAENDEKHIVGCATLCVVESPTGRKASVEDVVVLPAYRGQGIGRTLLQRIIDFAGNKLSPIDLRLTSNPTRTEANALYQNCNKQTFFVLFFVKVFVHFSGWVSDSLALVYS